GASVYSVSIIYFHLLLICAVFCRFMVFFFLFFFFSSRRRHTRFKCDWSSDVCSSDLGQSAGLKRLQGRRVHRTRLPRRALRQARSEERRVGKECRSRGATEH